MRLVLVGASRITGRCLEAVLDLADIEVGGVVTAPRDFKISYAPEGVTNVQHVDLPGVSEAHGVPCWSMESSMSDPELIRWVTGLTPDAFLVVGWYHMVPRVWRSIAPAYGIHASLLPKYRGGAPLVWALINGERETGVTLFELGDGVDDGPIVGQVVISVGARDTITTLLPRVEESAVSLVVRYLPEVLSGRVRPLPQPAEGVTVLPQRSPDDGLIDWAKSSEALDRWIRAQTHPYPGAFTYVDGQRLTIWAATPTSHRVTSEVGTVTRDNAGRYSVSCGVGALTLESVSLAMTQGTQKDLNLIFGAAGQTLGS